MQTAGGPQLDLTGKLIIKVALGEDIRRIPIHNEDITYDELVLMMQRVYRGKLSTNDEVTIKYKDEDGDLITIFDSSDLSFAIQCSRILKITLFVGGPKSLREPSDMGNVRRELQDIRDRVIDLLDRLEPSPLVGATQAMSLADGIVGKSDGASDSPVVNGVKTMNSVGGKEFDPLKSQLSNESTQAKVMASFGGGEANAAPSVSQSYDRAATPDSISSVGSSASNQVRGQHNMQQPDPQQLQAPQQHQQQQSQQPQQQQQQPPQQQPQQASPYPNQAGYGMATPGQMPQSYAGQPGYSAGQAPGQPTPQAPAPQPSPSQLPPSSQQQQTPPQQPQQQGYGAGWNNSYAAGYPSAAGQPAPGQMMYGQQQQQQPGVPNPYGQQAPGMPQPKVPGYPPAPAGQQHPSPGNPYSRGAPTYSAGYPRPSSGYPQ